MVKKYKKKPIVIEAFKYSTDDVLDAINFMENRDYYLKTENKEFYIVTLEGDMLVSDGDYIIKGVKDEFYPCKPDIFKQTYEEV